ncbi:MAG: helix-turn-helix domain-containing protein [Planctomycetota bacterium]|nr:helix-turn-helix domain-containing protein [Planctomycetota bacterium]
MNRMHVGDRLDDLLAEEGVLAEVEAAALRRVAALELRDLMKKVRVSKATLARRMGTSRAQLDRMLDPTGESSLTLRSLSAAVTAMGHTVSVKFERRARSSPATRTGKSKEKGAGHVASTAKTAKRSRV